MANAAIEIPSNELFSQHEYYYRTEVPVTARLLAESLIGLDGVVRISTDVLRALMPEARILRTDVLITGIELGSYKENFWVRLIFGEGENGEKRIEELRKKLGLATMEPKKIVAFALAAALLYGAYKWVNYATERPSDPQVMIHFENSFNQIGGEVGMDREELMALMDAALSNSDKEKLKRNVVKLLHPGGEKHDGEITIDGKEAFKVSPQIIGKVPNKYAAEVDEEPDKDIDHAQIVIRATDLDSAKKGWAAIIPELSDRRVPIELAPDIPRDKVSSGKYFYGDITVSYKIEKDGSRTIKRYYLRRFNAEVPARISDVVQPAEPPRATQ